MFRSFFLVLAASAGLICLIEAAPSREELQTAVKAILSVKAEGQGNEDARSAWQTLSLTQPSELNLLFSALDSALPVQANYLRSAIEVAIDRADPTQRQALVPSLSKVLLDHAHSFPTRNLAYEILGSLAPAVLEPLLPQMRDDPSEFLRREAVQQLLAQASQSSQKDPVSYRSQLQQALGYARDVDQVREIAQRLEKLGSPVDLPRHFGFLLHWQVIGPFDNTKREGFSRAEPPEQTLDLSLSHPGKHGPVSWKPFATSDSFGKVDFNQALAMEKEVLAYALAEFESDAAREVEFRLGTKNAWKLWLNGKLLFEREEYHRGQRIDQYRIKTSLVPGKNLILIKNCQDEQVKDWTIEWEFQLRVCDSTGTAVLAKNRLPTPPRETQRRRPPAPADKPTPGQNPAPVATKPS